MFPSFNKIIIILFQKPKRDKKYEESRIEEIEMRLLEEKEFYVELETMLLQIKEKISKRKEEEEEAVTISEVSSKEEHGTATTPTTEEAITTPEFSNKEALLLNL